MRKKNGIDDASLELLLDTICNTFGGILFISLLVVILLNTTSETVEQNPPSEVTAVELLEAEIQREELTRQLEQLQHAYAQQETVFGTLVTDEVVRLVSQLKESESEHSSLVVDKSEKDGELSQTQMEINQISKDRKDRKGKLNAARNEAAALERTLQEAVVSKSKQAIIPKASESNRSTQTYFLKGGKLYGPRTSSNTSDFILTSIGNGKQRVEENPSGGVRIDPKTSNATAVSSKLNNVSPTMYGITIFVWPDSYEHWEAVREILISKGYKYELKPCDDNTTIVTGASSGGSGTFQ